MLRKEGLDDAVRYFKRGLPTVCAVPADSKPTFVHKGVTFVQCPEQRSDKIQCATCNNRNPFCSQADRNFVVTFNQTDFVTAGLRRHTLWQTWPRCMPAKPEKSNANRRTHMIYSVQVTSSTSRAHTSTKQIAELH